MLKEIFQNTKINKKNQKFIKKQVKSYSIFLKIVKIFIIACIFLPSLFFIKKTIRFSNLIEFKESLNEAKIFYKHHLLLFHYKSVCCLCIFEIGSNNFSKENLLWVISYILIQNLIKSVTFCISVEEYSKITIIWLIFLVCCYFIFNGDMLLFLKMNLLKQGIFWTLQSSTLEERDFISNLKSFLNKAFF